MLQLWPSTYAYDAFGVRSHDTGQQARLCASSKKISFFHSGTPPWAHKGRVACEVRGARRNGSIHGATFAGQTVYKQCVGSWEMLFIFRFIFTGRFPAFPYSFLEPSAPFQPFQPFFPSPHVCASHDVYDVCTSTQPEPGCQTERRNRARNQTSQTRENAQTQCFFLAFFFSFLPASSSNAMYMYIKQASRHAQVLVSRRCSSHNATRTSAAAILPVEESHSKKNDKKGHVHDAGNV